MVCFHDILYGLNFRFFSMNLFLFFLLLVLIGFIVLKITRSRSERERSYNMIFLKILIPRKESERDKQENLSGQSNESFKEYIGITEHLFFNLHSIYKGKIHSWLHGTDLISLEYVFLDEQVMFFLVAPRKLSKLLEKQVTSFFPDAVVEEQKDYNIFKPDSKQATTYLSFSKNYAYPIRIYKNMETDPLNSIANSLSKLGKDETTAIQIIIRPVKNGWQKQCKKEVQSLQGHKKKGISLNPLVWVSSFIDMIFGGGESNKKGEEHKAQPLVEESVKAISEKAKSTGYEAIIRLICSAPSKELADENLSNIKSAFTQFGSPDTNSLSSVKKHSQKFCISNFLYRNFKKGFLLGLKPKMIVSCSEVASLFHFPSTRFNRINAIQWQNYKIAPAPNNVPTEGVLLGYNAYRGTKIPVYIKREDRFRHFYVIGQTGTGKSTILSNMVFQDIFNKDGVCVMDPHGQLAEDIFPYIPRDRADEIVYFNPADTDRPMGLNLLEAHDDEEKELVAMDAMNIMIKLFGNEIFGPRIQDYFRNGCLTIMSDPEGGALTDIVRLFTDDTFQQYKVKFVKNPIVKSFWEKQMAKTGAREKQEMIPYFAAKFGQFTTNALMRNIIGQAKSSFDIAEIMQNKKILLVNLSKGLIGDINSDLLGMIFVSKMQAAAMRRQKMAKEDRSDFFLYIDEFQNYITDAIESILSEARKYRLSLNIAHQYLDQLEKGGSKGTGQGNVDLKSAIFGNVGTIMCYKIGAKDAEYMEKEMSPVFSQQDLVNIDKYKAVMKLSIGTQPSRPFSIIPNYPFDSYKADHKLVEAFKQLSRLKYGRDKDFVTQEIFHRIGAADNQDPFADDPFASSDPFGSNPSSFGLPQKPASSSQNPFSASSSLPSSMNSFGNPAPASNDPFGFSSPSSPSTSSSGASNGSSSDPLFSSPPQPGTPGAPIFMDNMNPFGPSAGAPQNNENNPSSFGMTHDTKTISSDPFISNPTSTPSQQNFPPNPPASSN